MFAPIACIPPFQYQTHFCDTELQTNLHLMERIKTHTCSILFPAAVPSSLLVVFGPDIYNVSQVNICLESAFAHAQAVNPDHVFFMELRDGSFSHQLNLYHKHALRASSFSPKIVIFDYTPNVDNGPGPTHTPYGAMTNASRHYFFTNRSTDIIAAHPEIFSRHCVTSTPMDGIGIPTICIPFTQNHFSARYISDLTSPANFSSRPVLMHMQASLHGRGAALRLELFHQCESSSILTCSYEVTETDERFAITGRKSREPYSHPLKIAKFTLNPHGDDAPRSTVVKAMQGGSIPVLFSSCAAADMPHSFWARAYPAFLGPGVDSYGIGAWAVVLNYTQVFRNKTYVVDELSSVGTDAFARMQAYGQRILFRNLYADMNLPDREDAFDVIVQIMGTYPNHSSVASKYFGETIR